MLSRAIVVLSFALGMLVPAFGADAKYQMFLQLPGVQGACKAAGHVGEMELLGFSLLPKLLGASGAGKSTPISSAGAMKFTAPIDSALARQKGKPANFSCVKWVDKSSVRLSSFCRSGRAFPNAKLALCSAVGDKQVIMSFELTNVRIASYTMWGPGFAPPEPLAEYDIAKDHAECLGEFRFHCDRFKFTIFSNPEFAGEQPKP